MDIKIVRNLSYGVYIIGTRDGERYTGCTANSLMQITSSPATVAVSINHDNYTNSCIEKTGMFSCSVLSTESDPGLIGRFGFQSGRDTDKFSGIEYTAAESMPVIKDSCGFLVCRVIDKMETSTHTVFLGEIVEGQVFGDREPMTYAYYHKVVKGKSPKNAPTYIPDEEEKQEKGTKKFVCQICGYVYEGDSLPDDYKCPVCGQGADQFKET